MTMNSMINLLNSFIRIKLKLSLLLKNYQIQLSLLWNEIIIESDYGDLFECFKIKFQYLIKYNYCKLADENNNKIYLYESTKTGLIIIQLINSRDSIFNNI